MFKVIVARSTNFNDYLLFKKKMNFLLKNKMPNVQLIYGKDKNEDKIIERYAKDRKLSILPFQANWSKDGKSAGYKRNKRMINYADALLIFWDGKTKINQDLLKLAEEYNLKVRIVNTFDVFNEIN